MYDARLFSDKAYLNFLTFLWLQFAVKYLLKNPDRMPFASENKSVDRILGKFVCHVLVKLQDAGSCHLHVNGVPLTITH